MTLEPLSWCGESLTRHLAATALIAVRVYERDWGVVARRHGLPEWLLPAAALLHDVGKALTCYQEAAARACGAGRDPSFAMHEYASTYAAGLLLAAAQGLDDAGQAGLKAVAAAVWKHHHGMGGGRFERLHWPRDPRVWQAGVEAHAGPCRNKLKNTAEREAGKMLEVALAACRLAGLVDGRLCPPTLQSLLEAAASSRPPSLGSVYKRILALDQAHMQYGAAYVSASALLTAAVSVADTLAARAHRSPSAGPEGYTARLLAENECMRKAALDAVREAKRSLLQ